jgi:hypothetical protein
MYVETWILCVIYGFASAAFILAIYLLTILEDLKANGRSWIEYNRKLTERIAQLENPRYKK